ncbi:cadherin-like domain-containing protein [Dickeya solani]|nr:cadherin-like domain-containing protein [Dickeya solani]MCZ0786947.1 cadherin-like domain-containing protein [Dickeya solani]
MTGEIAPPTSKNTPVTVNVLANDSDVDGDPLTVTAASGRQRHGGV